MENKLLLLRKELQDECNKTKEQLEANNKLGVRDKNYLKNYITIMMEHKIQDYEEVIIKIDKLLKSNI
jgi:hypothetical protein